MSDYVHFLGRQPLDEVVRCMNAADVFVITSRTTADGDFEGYGIVVVEAALCGTPSVVSANSGLVEAIEDGRTGIAVAPEDPEDTARGIRRLLDDDALRQTMGERARTRAPAEQTWGQRAAECDRVFRALIAPRAGKSMKLVIISHTEHHLRDGVPVGWGPTVREISQLAGMFSSIRHVAMLYDGGAPHGEVAYDADNVTLVGLRPSGGSGLRAKLGILAAYPRYAAVLLREIVAADVVHVRAPANISLLAILLLPFLWRPARRWIKYAGNWKPDAPDAFSYRLQRWLLQRGWHRAQVTVNGHWPGDPPFIHNFINPCLTDEEFAGGQVVGSGKDDEYAAAPAVRGRLERAKGVERGLRVAGGAARVGRRPDLRPDWRWAGAAPTWRRWRGRSD
ncbi:MAG: glycosyltransferase [Chloroflexi bacterium]|nr:glycosyltransferase [Chloroflexota bacterium]